MILHRDRRFLVDAGEGTQRQILRSGLGFRRLDTVLLTHGHLDHILGLGGIASTFARWEEGSILTIYGGAFALGRVRDLMDVVLRGDNLQLEVRYIEVEPGPLIHSRDLEVVAFPVRHRGSGNFGYLFQEPSRRPFLADAADALGVPMGPERRQLVEGRSVCLADGTTVVPDQVLGPKEKGTRLVVVGDVGSVEEVRPMARGADALIIESTYLWEDRAAAKRYGHITARQAGELARDSGVGTLLLTHVSRRYPVSEVRSEVREVFPNAWVVDDLDHYQVNDGAARRTSRAGD